MKLQDMEATKRAGCAYKGSVRLAADLRKMRVDRGVTLRQIEAATGISNASWSQIERGKPPSIQTALKIAEFIGLPIEQIWALNSKHNMKRKAAKP